jgi:hypothetical protein
MYISQHIQNVIFEREPSQSIAVSYIGGFVPSLSQEDRIALLEKPLAK